jgi:hypothetical protein
VVNATSSPSWTVLPGRSATWYWAASTGPAAATHLITSAIGTPAAGAADGVVEVAEVLVAVRDGVIGVSWVWRACPLSPEHPAANRADAANTTTIRIPPG